MTTDLSANTDPPIAVLLQYLVESLGALVSLVGYILRAVWRQGLLLVESLFSRLKLWLLAMAGMDCMLGTTADVDYTTKVTMAGEELLCQEVGFLSALGNVFSCAFGKVTELGKDTLRAAVDMLAQSCLRALGYIGEICVEELPIGQEMFQGFPQVSYSLVLLAFYALLVMLVYHLSCCCCRRRGNENDDSSEASAFEWRSRHSQHTLRKAYAAAKTAIQSVRGRVIDVDDVDDDSFNDNDDHQDDIRWHPEHYVDDDDDIERDRFRISNRFRAETRKHGLYGRNIGDFAHKCLDLILDYEFTSYRFFMTSNPNRPNDWMMPELADLIKHRRAGRGTFMNPAEKDPEMELQVNSKNLYDYGLLRIELGDLVDDSIVKIPNCGGSVLDPHNDAHWLQIRMDDLFQVAVMAKKYRRPKHNGLDFRDVYQCICYQVLVKEQNNQLGGRYFDLFPNHPGMN